MAENKGIEALGKIEVSDPETLQAGIEQVRSRINELISQDRHKGDEFVNLNAQLHDLTEKFGKVEELAKNAARTVPGGLEESMRGIDLSVQPDGEFTRGAKVSPLYFGIMTSTESDLRHKGADDRTVAKAAELRELNDALFYQNAKRQMTDSGYNMNGGIRSLKLWPRFEQLSKEFARANSMADATSNLGSDFVPTMLSSNLMLLIQAQLKLASAFNLVQMPSVVYNNPVEGADATAYLIAEATTDVQEAGVITASTFATSKLALTAKKIAARVVTSMEWEEDSIIPVSQEISRKIAKALARGLEDGILNGQYTGNIDTGTFYAPAASSAKKAFDGLRYAANASARNVDGSTLTAAALLGARGAMGGFGIDPTQLIWVTGFSGYQRLLALTDNSNGVLLGLDKMGPDAVLQKGALGSLFGSPVIVSEFMPETQETTGLVTAASAGASAKKTSILCVNKDAFLIGERKGVTVDVSRDQMFNTAQTVYRGMARWAFACGWTPSATVVPVGCVAQLASF